MTSFAKVFTAVSVFFLMAPIYTPPQADSAPPTYDVHFEILNDDQAIPSVQVSQGQLLTAPIAGTDYIERANVRLNGWYGDAALTDRFDFENDTIVEPITLYAQWAYLKDSISKASLIQSSEGTSFTVGTISLSLVLYAPMQTDLDYQWQQKLVSGIKWIDILGETDATYQPRNNGTYQFRVLYWVQEEDDQGVLETVRKESQAVTLTLSGAFEWQPLLYLLGLSVIGGGLFLFYRKRPLSYVVLGGEPIAPRGFVRLKIFRFNRPRAKKGIPSSGGISMPK